jgi:hypothetical protein
MTADCSGLGADCSAIKNVIKNVFCAVTNNDCCLYNENHSVSISCIDAPSSTDNEDDTKKLSPGAIVGISIGSLAGAVFLGFMVYRLCRKDPKASPKNVSVGSLLF